MPKEIASMHELASHVKLLCQPLGHTNLASIVIAVPAGIMHQPENQVGIAWLLGEMLDRGTRNLSSRAWMDALELCGALQDQSLQSNYLAMEVVGPAGEDGPILEALGLVLDAFFYPALPETDFESCRTLTLQAIESVKDDPIVLGYELLYEKHLSEVLGRPDEGRPDMVRQLSIEDVRTFHRSHFQPSNLVIAAAGHIQPGPLIDYLEAYFSKWPDAKAEKTSFKQSFDPGQSPTYPQRFFEAFQSQQINLFWASRSAPANHPDRFYDQLLAEILTGGMTGRLFWELREKRGLCYSVESGYAGNNHYGMLHLNVGTSPEHESEVNDVVQSVCQSVRENGVEALELSKSVNGILCDFLAGQESGIARAYSMLSDFERFGRLRTDEEVEASLHEITLEKLNAHLVSQPLFEDTYLLVGDPSETGSH